jgi:S-adenosylmethionine:tRNA ribosyltransferase-isomerase
MFRDFPQFLAAGDLVIVNDTRVIPARLFGTLRRENPRSLAAGPVAGASDPATPSALGEREVELLLLREEPAVAPERIWSALARPARSLQPGDTLSFVDPSYAAAVVGTGERGMRRVSFRPARPEAPPFEAWLSRVGHVPLPPYIDRADEPDDRDRYQTIFAREAGSVAAPTAGLHFTDETVAAIHARGAATAAVTLHVGAGTFRPVTAEDPAEHSFDPEPYRVPPETASMIGSRPPRVVAVGTTSVRTLESWALEDRPDDGGFRETGLFILPPFEFRVVNALLTNFHLPRSGLLMLVCAFAGRDPVLAAYREAVREGYRFYSYGDAMLVI